MVHSPRIRRSGVSLIEVTVVMSMMAVLLGLAIPLLAQLQRGVQTGRDAVTDSRTLSRLAQDFRADVRAAEGVELPAAAEANPAAETSAAKLLELRLAAGRRVTYIHAPSEIRREERLAAPPADDKQASPLRREVYRLADLQAARAGTSSEAPQRVTLLLDRSPPSPLRVRAGSERGTPLTLTIDAFRRPEVRHGAP